MNKKISVLLFFIISLFIAGIVFICTMFAEQYNLKGVSSFLNITIDENQKKEYIGKLDNYHIYVEGLKIDELYFITISNEHISLKDAIYKKVVSVKDWRKKSWHIKKVGDVEFLQYENYEIEIDDEDCIIRPIMK